MAINKVEANGETLIDLTSDTVTADTLVSGRTAHLASGAQVTGTFEPVTGVKGNAESTYRKGNVNLTPANIGAATSAQGDKADSAVQTIQIGGTTQTKTSGTVNLPTYPTKSSLGLSNVDNTSDANKPISTATQAALDAQQAQINKALEQTGYNLLEITTDTRNVNGVTFTVDKVAGTITANGTATALIAIPVSEQLSDILEIGKSYHMTGCPSGGSFSSKYALYVALDGTTVWRDEGSGEQYSVPQSGTLSALHLIIRSGVTVSNLVFKPMIVPSELAGVPFQPYAEPNYQLTQKVDRALEQTGYNLLEITTDTRNVNGVTFTVDKVAGTITANGTATALIAIPVSEQLSDILEIGKSYHMTGCPSGGSFSSKYALYVALDGTTVWRDEGSGEQYSVPQSGTLSALHLIIRSGVTVSNLVFKPMIVPAELAGVPFQPYAMSNVELTQKALIKEDDNAGGYDITLDKPFTLRYGFYAISITRNGITLDQGGDIVSIKSDGIYFNGEKVGS